jgi:acetyltransferase-like isoleucine patch superfamily enzyme
MLMKIIRYLLCLPKVIVWKIKYHNRLKLHPLQNSHWNTDIKIKGKADVTIGHSLETRRGVCLRIEGGSLILGSGSFINTNSNITCIDKIIIGKNCRIGNNVVIIDHDHDYSNLPNAPLISTPVYIGDNVWIGANSVILRGTEIGDNCVIAAGSIVKGHIPRGTLLYQEKRNILKELNASIEKR